jgi:uncharacterized protein DUF1707
MAGRRASLRASDDDREKVADRLRHAVHEGRLTTDEFETRLGSALGAKTYGELDSVLSDLPGDRLPAHRSKAHGPMVTSLAGVGLVIVVATIAVLVIATIALLSAAWVAWMVIAWLVFGRRHHVRRMHQHRARQRQYYGRSQPSGPGRSFWA